MLRLERKKHALFGCLQSSAVPKTPSLHMERNEPLGADHRNPTFPASFVTKPVVTQGINRYQMKDSDIVFQQIPLALVYCRSSGIDTTASQSQAFFEILKLTIFNLRLKSIQKATNEDFWMKLKAGETLNIKFQNMKKVH